MGILRREMCSNLLYGFWVFCFFTISKHSGFITVQSAVNEISFHLPSCALIPASACTGAIVENI